MSGNEMIWIIGFLAIGIILVAWKWLNAPYHHRGVRSGSFPDFFESLHRAVDGSTMIVQDEAIQHPVVVEKSYSDSHAIRFSLETQMAAGAQDTLQRSLREGVFEASVEKGTDSVRVTVSSPSPLVVGAACESLRQVLGVLGSSSGSSYHIYFMAKLDAESSRKRYEELRDDPAASRLRRRTAEGVLRSLDERLRRKVSGRKE